MLLRVTARARSPSRPDGPWATRVREVAAASRRSRSSPACSPRPARAACTTRCWPSAAGVDASYDKIHMFDAFGFAESDTVAPGTKPVTITSTASPSASPPATTCGSPLCSSTSPPRRDGDAAARVVGRRGRQAGAVGAAGAGPRAGLHRRTSWPATRPIRRRSAASTAGRRPGSAASLVAGPRGDVVAADGGRSRSCSSPTSTPRRRRRPASRSRCWPTAGSERLRL